MKQFDVKEISNLLHVELSHLVEESKEDGFRFLVRLVEDYKNGTNNFTKPGEALFEVLNNEGIIIAIGGLNIDPYSDGTEIGRLRRFYVSKNYRRTGVGKLLLEKILEHAKGYFKIVVLHTDTDNADKFYLAYGFLKGNPYHNATHYLDLTSVANLPVSETFVRLDRNSV